ncbi:hypothetical protein BGW39_002327 [Mortierella sp. 14UC]|nr:hypothetical protein BGW39_002327 [Mortierella sp. 14UC]
MAPRPVIPVTEKTISSHPVEPNPVQTDPRPVIPANLVVEKATTTTRHSDSTPIQAASAPRPVTNITTERAAPMIAPVVAAAAVAPLVDNNRTTSTTTPYDSRPNTIQSAPVPQQQVITNRASAAEVDSADKIATAIPESYHGPIPNRQPDDNNPVVTNVNAVGDGPGGNVNPAQGMPANTVHDNSSLRRRCSGFFNRLMHRHRDNVDKGKQRK